MWDLKQPPFPGRTCHSEKAEIAQCSHSFYFFYCSFIIKLNPESLDFLLKIRHVFIFLRSAVANQPPYPLPEGRLVEVTTQGCVAPGNTGRRFLLKFGRSSAWEGNSPGYQSMTQLSSKILPFLGCSSVAHLVFTKFSRCDGADGGHGHSLQLPTN